MINQCGCRWSWDRDNICRSEILKTQQWMRARQKRNIAGWQETPTGLPHIAQIRTFSDLKFFYLSLKKIGFKSRST